MEISVLIPTYNYDCSSLVQQLHQQLDCSGAEYELLIVDDGSTDEAIAKMLQDLAHELPNVAYHRQEKSRTRAAMRNQLWRYAKFEWQLQVNSNVQVLHDNFVKLYLDAISDNVQVICGNCNALQQTDSFTLRNYYEQDFYKKNRISYCNQHPFAFFRNTNCMYRRSVFEKCKYNEAVKGYGCEDFLFGETLKEAHITIKYIDNPVTYVDFESSREYLQKTQEALHTLASIAEQVHTSSGLLNVVRKLDGWHLAWVIRIWHRLFEHLEESNLCSSHPNLTLFALYKLGYYLNIREHK